MLQNAITEQTRIPHTHMELFFDNHPFKPVSHFVKDLPMTTVVNSRVGCTTRLIYCLGGSSNVLVRRCHL